ncbi:unnamed protein product [Closterium sp. NIES-54]
MGALTRCTHQNSIRNARSLRCLLLRPSPFAARRSLHSLPLPSPPPTSCRSLRSPFPSRPPLRSPFPSRPSLRSPFPSHPSLRSPFPSRPSLRSPFPSCPSIRSPFPSRPSLCSLFPSHPSLRSPFPSHPSLRSSSLPVLLSIRITVSIINFSPRSFSSPPYSFNSLGLKSKDAIFTPLC